MVAEFPRPPLFFLLDVHGDIDRRPLEPAADQRDCQCADAADQRDAQIRNDHGPDCVGVGH